MNKMIKLGLILCSVGTDWLSRFYLMTTRREKVDFMQESPGEL
jgi:hypothetical protein